MQISLRTMETCEHNVKLDNKKKKKNLLELQNVIRKLQDLKNLFFFPCAKVLLF